MITFIKDDTDKWVQISAVLGLQHIQKTTQSIPGSKAGDIKRGRIKRMRIIKVKRISKPDLAEIDLQCIILKKLCQLVGCNGTYRPWTQYINPSDIFEKAVNKEDSKAKTLNSIKQKVIKLTDQMDNTSPARLKRIENQAKLLLQELKQIKPDITKSVD